MFLPMISKKEIATALNTSIGAISGLMSRKELISKDEMQRGREKYYPSSIAREIFNSRGHAPKKRVITFNNLKGGTGKTTLSINLATRLTSYGFKVLFIDLDKQGNSTASLYGKLPEFTLYHIVTGLATLPQALVKVNDFLTLLPSSLVNQKLEVELTHSKFNPEVYLKNLLAPVIDAYDFVIIDTPADISRAVILAYLYSTDLVIPVQLDEYCMQGIEFTVDQVAELRENYPSCQIKTSVLVNEFDKRKTRSMKYLNDIEDFEDTSLLPLFIRTDSSLEEALTSNFELDKVLNFRKKDCKEDIDQLVFYFLGLELDQIAQ